jgi:hypothetical protein
MAIQNPAGKMDANEEAPAFEEAEEDQEQKKKKEEEAKQILKLKVNFLCCVYVENLIVTGGEDGIVKHPLSPY